jgi:hypothetical protein
LRSSPRGPARRSPHFWRTSSGRGSRCMSARTARTPSLIGRNAPGRNDEREALKEPAA